MQFTDLYLKDFDGSGRRPPKFLNRDSLRSTTNRVSRGRSAENSQMQLIAARVYSKQ